MQRPFQRHLWWSEEFFSLFSTAPCQRDSFNVYFDAVLVFIVNWVFQYFTLQGDHENACHQASVIWYWCIKIGNAMVGCVRGVVDRP